MCLVGNELYRFPPSGSCYRLQFGVTYYLGRLTSSPRPGGWWYVPATVRLPYKRWGCTVAKTRSPVLSLFLNLPPSSAAIMSIFQVTLNVAFYQDSNAFSKRDDRVGTAYERGPARRRVSCIAKEGDGAPRGQRPVPLWLALCTFADTSSDSGFISAGKRMLIAQ